MAWYGNHVDASKKLDQLIDQNPTLQQLLSYPDFIQQLKAYNPKLLQFLTNSSTIISDLINFIAVPPKETDSQQRKYKLPTMVMQMIESQAMSILNSFFKQDEKKKQKYFITMFEQFLKNSNKVDGQLLPILAGYFLRANICLLNNKYKQTIDCVYESPKNFQALLQNSHSLSVTNTLQVFLNLDLTKNSQTIPQRLSIKINAINFIVRIIDQCIEHDIKSKSESERNFCSVRVENLSSVLIELFQKYYLIADGKQMVNQVLDSQNHIKVFFKSIFYKGSDISISSLNILISILKFYSFSSFNTQEWNNIEQSKKNQQKLQSQPAILALLQVMPQIIQALTKCNKFSLHDSKFVELVNMSLALNSHKIFNCVRNCKYFETLIQLLFTYQECNIFGQMLQKLFLLIFRTERHINEEIKHFIFCELKIIDLTAGRYLTLFQNDEQIAASMANNFRRKGYFGHLMKIMKIYSGIQTTDEDIINAIKNKSEIWNKISRLILKPYQMINLKQLSTYDNIPDMSPNQFTVKTLVGISETSRIRRQADSTRLIDEVNRQETIQIMKTLQTNSLTQNKIQAQNVYHPHQSNQRSSLKNNDDQFFSPPTQNISEKTTFNSESLGEKKISESSLNSENDSQNLGEQRLMNSPGLGKKSASYSDFMQKQKVKAQTEIKKQRSRSKQRALSKGKTKITSPSPTKRVNKWAQNPDQKGQSKQPKQRVSLTGSKPPSEIKNLPKIPMHKKGIIVSSSSNESQKQQVHNKSMQLQKKEQVQNEIVHNKSMPNLQQLKRVKIVYQFQAPTKRQYRKINEEDKTIFDMLGIAYS